MSKESNVSPILTFSEEKTCPNCDKGLDDSHSFCPYCGQERIKKQGFRGFMDQFLKDYFTFDSKFLGSIRPLLFSPGFLTTEYLSGHLIRYIPPLRLFIFTSILFFLLIGFSGGSGWKEFSGAQLQESQFWDDFFSVFLPRMFFLFLPMFALLVRLFFGKKGEGFTKHFLFSAHFHSFVFLIGCFYWMMSKLLKSFDLVSLNAILLGLCSVYVLIYLFIALRRVYGLKKGKTLLRFFGLGTLYTVGLSAGALISLMLILKI